MVHDNQFFSIYFGNAQDMIFPTHYAQQIPDCEIICTQPFANLAKLFSAGRLHFPRQTHSQIGYVVLKEESISFALEADYLLTQEKKIGIGIMTADCLPIILYDSKQHAAAAVHAGRRGALAGIADNAVRHMTRLYGTQPEDLSVFFGPCIKKCCYHIGQEVADQIAQDQHADQVLQVQEQAILFDLPAYNRLRLESMGIPDHGFNTAYNLCTACDPLYWSYRRDGQQAGRQMTVIALK